MKTLFVCRFLPPAAILIGSVGALAECPPPVAGEDPFVREQFLIGIAPDADPAAVIALIESQFPGTTVIDAIPNRGFYLMQPPINVVDCDAVELLIENLVNPDPTLPDPLRPLSFAELNYEGGSPERQTGTIFIDTHPNSNGQMVTQYA